MISRDSMMQPILSVSPSFEPVWREFLAEWQGDPDGLPVYLALSDLARHMAALFDRGAESELREIFEIVEAWHLNGAPYVKEAATVGLLEDLQNTNISRRTDTDASPCLSWPGVFALVAEGRELLGKGRANTR
jgi:hypothetical protein